MANLLSATTLTLNDLHNTPVHSASVVCFMTDLSEIKQLIQHETPTKLLSSAELDRLANMSNPAARERFVAGRALIRHCLSHYLTIAPENIHIETSGDGKPYQEHDCQLGFNLSHTGNQFALAISRTGNVGIDIERHKPRKQLFLIAQAMLTETEQCWFNQLAPTEQTAAFYRLWSLKEAILKADGVGLNLSMNSIGFTEQLSVDEWPDELGPQENWRWLSQQEHHLSLALAVMH